MAKDQDFGGEERRGPSELFPVSEQAAEAAIEAFTNDEVDPFQELQSVIEFSFRMHQPEVNPLTGITTRPNPEDYVLSFVLFHIAAGFSAQNNGLKFPMIQKSDVAELTRKHAILGSGNPRIVDDAHALTAEIKEDARKRGLFVSRTPTIQEVKDFIDSPEQLVFHPDAERRAQIMRGFDDGVKKSIKQGVRAFNTEESGFVGAISSKLWTDLSPYTQEKRLLGAAAAKGVIQVAQQRPHRR